MQTLSYMDLRAGKMMPQGDCSDDALEALVEDRVQQVLLPAVSKCLALWRLGGLLIEIQTPRKIWRWIACSRPQEDSLK